MSHQIAILAIQIGLMLVVARLLGMLASKCRLPSVMGELMAGILMGPYCLGQIPVPLSGFEHGVFPLLTGGSVPIDPVLYSIATLGAIVLLFVSGLETDVRTFFRYSVVGTAVGIGGIICSFFCGAAVGIFVLHWTFLDPRTLFLGILCTATSVGITARILSDRSAMDTPEGVTIMAAAVIDDVLGIVCLAIVIGIVNSEIKGTGMAWGRIGIITLKSCGIWLGATAIGLLCSHYLASFMKFFKSAKVFTVMSLGLALIVSGLFEEAGLAMIIGAFVMGLSLSKTDVAFKIRSSIDPLYNFLVPLFFVAMGMLVDIRVLANLNVLKLGLIFTVMAILGKVVGCFFPALFMNFKALGALRIGVGMIPRCEVVLIIAGIAASTMMKNPALSTNPGAPAMVPIFDSELVSISIIMPLITALVAPPLLNLVLSIKGKGVRKEAPDKHAAATLFTFPSEAIANNMLQEIVLLLKRDDFVYSAFYPGIKVIQFRRNECHFTLQVDGCRFVFNSDAGDIPLIKAAVYESIVELHKSLVELRQLAEPEKLKNTLFGDIKPAPGKTSTAAIPLERLITPLNVKVRLHSDTKEGVFRELVELANITFPLANLKQCYDDILEREAIVSTYEEDGIAMPHARTVGAARLSVAIGIKPDGIAYKEGERAQIFILSLCPKDQPGPYLIFISQIAQILAVPEKRARLLAAHTPEEACNAILKG